jgi:hypothetical protein
MKYSLPPRDRGDRTATAKRSSGRRRLMPGAFRLAHGITNDSQHAGRHAACKNGSLYMGVELNGRGPGIVPVTLPGAHVSRSGRMLSHRGRDRHAPETHVRGAMETERVDPSPGALGHPAAFCSRARRSTLRAAGKQAGEQTSRFTTPKSVE